MTSSDPLAAIARLGEPAAPWLHLLDGAAADARQLAWLLAERGVVTRILRGYCMRTRFGLYDEIGAALQLPGDAIEDWAGLLGSLTDMPWLPGQGHVLVVTSAALTLSADAGESAALWEALVEIGRRRTDEVEVGTPVPFHVVLADDAAGLALLRARLGGTAFDELSGWEPQEPAVVRGRGIRTSFVPAARSDDLDERAVAAVRDRDEVLSLHRAGERFRGSHESETVVYGAVIDRFDGVPELTAALAGAVAEHGAQVLVVSDIEAARNPRQRDFLAAATELWPEPAPKQPEEPAGPAGLERSGSSEQSGGSERRGSGPAEPEPAVPEEPAVRTSAPDEASEQDGAFEIVAANLEWEFSPGDGAPDPIDEQVVRFAADETAVGGVWRCWCRDPRRDRWVRVLMSVVDGDAGTVDRVRKGIVSALEASAAGRCCVEVVGAADAGEAHEWLQEQSVRLVGAREPHAEQSDAGLGPDEPAEPERAVPGSAGPGAPEEPDEPDAEPGEDESAESAQPEPETRYAPVDADPDEAGRRLITWAERNEAIAGLVHAWAVTGEHREQVYGVVVGEGEHDLADLASQARAVLAGAEASVVSFAPSRRLDREHLALYRGGTRLWRRAAERPAPSPAQGSGFQYTKLSEFSRLQVQTGELDNGVTLLEISTDWVLSAGAPEPEPADQAVIDWAREAEHVIGLCRAVGSYTGTRTWIYTVMVDALSDGDVPAAAIADCVAPHGVQNITVLSFCPFGSISIFHQDVFRSSTVLWTTDEDLTPEQRGEEPPAQ